MSSTVAHATTPAVAPATPPTRKPAAQVATRAAACKITLPWSGHALHAEPSTRDSNHPERVRGSPPPIPSSGAAVRALLRTRRFSVAPPPASLQAPDRVPRLARCLHTFLALALSG